MSEIKYAYGDGHISPLPASGLLAPSLLTYGALRWLCSSVDKANHRMAVAEYSKLMREPGARENQARYFELSAKFRKYLNSMNEIDKLSGWEMQELGQLTKYQPRH